MVTLPSLLVKVTGTVEPLVPPGLLASAVVRRPADKNSEVKMLHEKGGLTVVLRAVRLKKLEAGIMIASMILMKELLTMPHLKR
jgi:hypothetical protein